VTDGSKDYHRQPAVLLIARIIVPVLFSAALLEAASSNLYLSYVGTYVRRISFAVAILWTLYRPKGGKTRDSPRQLYATYLLRCI
jgi:hypothetical protein